MTEGTPFQDNVPPLPKSKSGVNGCLIGCLIAVLVAAIGTGAIVYFSYSAMTGAINEMTESEPRELPAVTIDEAGRAAANEKFTQLKSTLDNGGETKEFTFTGDEINALLRTNDTGVFGESVYVTVANGEIRGEVSLDLGRLIPLGIFDGRYANGSATFNVYTRDNRLFVFVESFQMKGEDAPAELVAQMRTKNLAEDMASDPSVQEWMGRIEAIDVVEDKVVVKLK